MIKAWIELLKSKKFWMTLLGSTIVLVMYQLGMPEEIVLWVGGLFGVAVGGQGLADMGKEKAKIEKEK